MADDPIVPPPEPVSTETPVPEAQPTPSTGEAAAGSASQEATQPSASAEPAGKAPAPDPNKAREEFFAKWKEEDPKTKPPEAEPAAEEEKAPEAVAEPAEDSEPDPAEITNEVASKTSPGEIRRRHNKLVQQRNEARGKLAELEPLAQLGTDIITTSSAAGWTPKQYVQVMQAAVAAHRGDPTARAQLQTFLGLQPAQTQPVWSTEDENILTDLVSSGDITGEAAKTLRARFAKAAQVAPAAPATQQTPPPAPPRQPPQDITPRIADALERATKGISEADLPKIDAEIKRELDTYRQRHPELSREAYPAVIEAIASGVAARHKAATRQVPVIRQSLRPGSTPTKTPTTGTQTSAKEAFFSRW